MTEKSVLLVEDNANDEALVLRVLKRHNILNKVSVVRDGAEALEYLFATGAYAGDKTPDLPVVVLLDLKLPKVDGLEVLRQVRATERTKLLPVVVLTSSKEDRDMVESYSLGANSYVRKPVEFSEFAEAVRNLSLYWLIINEAPPRKGASL
jgi:two-component system, response regulator